jgi:hypothetical protein
MARANRSTPLDALIVRRRHDCVTRNPALDGPMTGSLRGTNTTNERREERPRLDPVLLENSSKDGAEHHKYEPQRLRHPEPRGRQTEEDKHDS